MVAFWVRQNDLPASVLEADENVFEVVKFAAHRQLD